MAIVNTLKELLTSKKFLTAIAGTITGAALKIGLELDTEAVLGIISPLVAYILAQGGADFGKSAAKP